MTVGGVPGTILTGQSPLLICAGVLAAATLDRRWWLAVVIGVVVATAKPHLCAPALLLLLLAPRPVSRANWVALVAALVLGSRCSRWIRHP